MKKTVEKRLKKQIQQAISRQMSKNDRLLAKVLTGQELSADDTELWQRYNFVIDLRVSGYSKAVICKMLMERFEISHPTALRMVDGATQIFGERQASINKRAEAELMAEQLMEMFLKAKRAGDLKTAKDCLAERAKLLRLFEDDAKRIAPTLPQIQLTVNMSQAEADTEDADYQEITIQEFNGKLLSQESGNEEE